MKEIEMTWLIILELVLILFLCGIIAILIRSMNTQIEKLKSLHEKSEEHLKGMYLILQDLKNLDRFLEEK